MDGRALTAWFLLVMGAGAACSANGVAASGPEQPITDAAANAGRDGGAGAAGGVQDSATGAGGADGPGGAPERAASDGPGVDSAPMPAPAPGGSFYVDAARGDDGNDGRSVERPFKTLTRARDAVRAVNATMTGDLHVLLRGGTHMISSALELDDRDSGMNGHHVLYRAYPDERPVISGGRRLDGWTLHDAGKNIHRAAIGKIETRQLYVDGVRMQRARGPNLAGFVRSADGFIHDDPAVAGWRNVGDLEISIFNDHSHSRVPVESARVQAGKSFLKIRQPAWDHTRVRKNDNGTTTPDKYVNHLENALELLDMENEWYYDRATHHLYFKAPAGTDLAKAEVIVPLAEKLLIIKGRGLDRPAHHLKFEGIAFHHATWLRPSSAEGHNDSQSNILRRYLGGAPRPPGGPSFGDTEYLTAAAVELDRAEQVHFTRCEFARLGSAAINMVNGCKHVSVIGSRILDVSGSGIQIGEPDMMKLELYVPTDARTKQEDIAIKNNYLRDCGVEFRSSAGVFYATGESIDISHNELSNIVSAPIAGGWGWEYMNPGRQGRENRYMADKAIEPYSRNNKINHNYIHECLSGLSDMGALYTMGQQRNSEMRENHVTGVSRAGFGNLYPDRGTAYWTIDRNVVDDTQSQWLHLWMPQIHDVKVTNTFTRNSNFENNGTNCPVTGTTLVSRTADWPQAAKDIIRAAGLEPAYRDVAPVETLKFSAVEDAFATESSPDASNGGAPEIRFAPGNRRNSYLRFRVAGLGQRTVRAVRLLLAERGGSAQGNAGFEVRKVTGPWTESTMTWNTQPAREARVLGNSVEGRIPSDGTIVRVDLSPALVGGDGVYDLALVAIEGADTSYFDGREAVNEPLLFLDVR